MFSFQLILYKNCLILNFMEIKKDLLKKAAEELIKYFDDNKIEILKDLDNILEANNYKTQKFGPEYIAAKRDPKEPAFDLYYIVLKKMGSILDIRANYKNMQAFFNIRAGFKIPGYEITEENKFGKQQYKILVYANVPEIKEELESLVNFLSEDS